MARGIDKFSILVREVRPLKPEGYRVTLELRRKPESTAENSDIAPAPIAPVVTDACQMKNRSNDVGDEVWGHD
jgi:hypothetical protein